MAADRNVDTLPTVSAIEARALQAVGLFSVISSCAATSTSRNERQIGIAKQRFGVMDIERDARRTSQKWKLRNFRQFDTPFSIVVTYDRSIHGSDIAPSRLRRRR